ncbi:head-tail connector protein [Pseudooctadecabacter jejudonensis]|uniref:Phage gp6-like head-tail connector protein n=1 Tax=Pseudooctadecabacter jejudonensis TaxID=1391910 RepID=A0A1Y5TB11_9RHOB|nr:head-tail connector protein [Pseudooctadecabacter jejudonensis]SLN59756.1 Phage gp6-like head-tail connector protein [Pseudooctadecabacter jejudonensis]
MMLIEETFAPAAALPVALFKEHLRLGSGFSDDGLQDTLLESFLRSALAAIEARTGKALLERTFSWTLTRWRDASMQVLPLGPVSAIVDVTLVDRVGGEIVVDADAYTLRPDMQRPAIVAAGVALPSIPQAGSVKIQMLAGFGPEWGDLPADLAQAVLLLAAHYYEYRHEVQYDGGCMPFGVSALIERYRVMRLTGGGQQ